MNKFCVFALTAIGFGGGGVALGYFLARKKYFDLADKEVASIKAKAKEHDEWLLKKHGLIKDDDSKQETKNTTTASVTPSSVKPGVDRLDKEKQAAEYVNYSNIAGKYGEEGSQREVVHENGIFIITRREFDESDYNYQSIRYYEKEGFITDADDNVISNFKSLVGDEALWKDMFGETNIVYVRNTLMEMDYEIVRCVDSWNDIASPAQKSAVINSVGETEDDD